MTILFFSFLLLGISILAGIVGALTGLGGGIVLIPALVLFFDVNIHYAMGASLVSVIATSSGAAAAFLQAGYTNLRIGMFLETGAIFGALIGAIVVAMVPKTLIIALFAIVLFISAYLTLARKEETETLLPSHPLAEKLDLMGSYLTSAGRKEYSVQRVPEALGVMGIAGFLSGLLGIGAGALKVLAMDQLMRLPYKVATSTSNFIIGITATASVGVYYAHGYIDPGLIFPVLIGVSIGSIVGAKILSVLHTNRLRIIFSIVVCFLGIEMLYKAITGSF